MTREKARTNLIALGIEEPTKEQIDGYLNSFQDDVQREKDAAKELKEKADKYDEAQRLLDEEKTKNLTAEEKIQAAIDAANVEKANFAKASNKLAVEKILLGAGLVEEDYKDLIDGIVSDNKEASTKLATSLATMLSGKISSTEAKVKQEMLDANPLPPGTGGTPDLKTEAEKIASSLAKSSVDTTQATSIIDNYK